MKTLYTAIAALIHVVVLSSNSTLALTVTTSVSRRLSRGEAGKLVNEAILPKEKYSDRIKSGIDAQGLQASTVVTGNDPSLTRTYGEFPTHSTDELVDLALTHIAPSSIDFVDLGSGCGRLALYFALTRGSNEQPWKISGIEISDILHAIASDAVEIGRQQHVFHDSTESSSSSSSRDDDSNTLALHLGAAEDMTAVFGKAQLIFAYCTVWESSGFSEELAAIVLHSSWSEMLAKSCRKGCVVITTDRVLDPNYGWKLLNRLDVDNREVAGSTGYIQILT